MQTHTSSYMYIYLYIHSNICTNEHTHTLAPSMRNEILVREVFERGICVCRRSVYKVVVVVQTHSILLYIYYTGRHSGLFYLLKYNSLVEFVWCRGWVLFCEGSMARARTATNNRNWNRTHFLMGWVMPVCVV